MSAVLLAQHTRKAAHGLHRCGWCGENIAKGERYTDQRIADNGSAYTWREHPACAERIWKWWRAQGYYEDEMTDGWIAWAEMLAEEEGQ
jgi:hypothetical protein